MPRATNNPASKQRRKKLLKRAKGFYGRGKSTIRAAHRLTDRAGQFSFKHRRVRRREFRALWIQRINAACRENGMSYSQFIHLLNESELGLDRKALAHLAFHDPDSFAAVIQQVKA